MMFSFMLVDDDQPLRLCKHCQKVFLGSRSNAAFCSPRCKNQYNVYKSREKSKEKQTNEGTVASIGHQYDCDLPTPTIQMEIVYNVGSHDVYSSHLQIKTAQTTILGGLRCFGIQNDS